jgi:hypothetical protein
MLPQRVRRAVALVLGCLLAVPPAAVRAAEPPGSGWDRYQIILWHTQEATAAQLAAAQRLGVTGGLVFGVRDDMPEAALAAELRQRAAPLLAAGLAPYAENIATDFYAAYHRWRPDRPVTFAFDQVQAWHQAVPADPSVFVRDPSLSDPAWLARIGARLAAHARALGPDRPLFYSLGDETGIADLTAAWDFDRSAASLAGFRTWLQGEYGSLETLNREWGTGFADWSVVVPLTTDAALHVGDGNFAAWADFRAWMDTAFARALRAGTEALHQADSMARAGIEGGQVPGTGGYDYTKLSPAVDVLEVSGGDPAFDIAHALNPALVLLTTTGGNALAAVRHGLWRALLAGGRGTILWDPDAQLVRPDGSAGARGMALAPLFAELRGPTGATVLAATPRPDPVAILYSPASFRTRWILDRQTDAARGKDWSRRRSETELEDNALRVAMRQAAGGLSHLGLEPRWLSPARLAGDGLKGVRALLLPQALALSDADLSAIRAFIAAGGHVLADIPPGGFDAHSRRRAAPLTEGVTLLPGLPTAALGAALAAAGVAPAFTLAHPDGSAVADVTVRVLQHGGTLLLGLQRDLDAVNLAEDVVLSWPQPHRLRDVRAGGETTADRLALRLDAVAPTILTVEK